MPTFLFRYLRYLPGMSLLNPFAWIRRMLFVAILGYCAVSAYTVWNGANTDEGDKPANVLVVLGAAQYNGVPSPVLKERLDHALSLYRVRRGAIVVVTGGRQKGDATTEAAASAKYLMRNGVPDIRIEREVDGHDTYSSLAAVSRFLRGKQLTGVIFVTDGFHAARVKAIGKEVGLKGFVSPSSKVLVRSRWIHESVAVGLGRLIGYRRLSVFFG